MNRCASIALVALTSAACGQERTRVPAPRAEIRDSAGIRIVENPRPPEGSRLAWRIGPEPLVSIGVLEGEEAYMLYGALDATRLSDGRIVVANRGTNELRVFDASGTHLENWAGEGEGPGEFTSLSRVEPWPGDSIAAWWTRTGGISVFDSDGNYGRTFRLGGNDEDPIWLALRPESATRAGSVLATWRWRDADTIVVHLRDGEGDLKARLGTHPGPEYHLTPPGAYRFDLWEQIFGRRLVHVPWGDLVVIGRTDRYQLRAFRADGSLARIVRRQHVPRPPERSDIEAQIEEQVSLVPLEWSPEEIERYQADVRRGYRAAPVAEHLPALDSVMADALDHLWVREFESPADDRPGVPWTVFDPEGRVLGFVETPEDLKIYEIGSDYLLGHSGNELEVESVQLWPLER
ncbi:hypothetical protein [Candidatus Palauibacter sp.]|uniref:hypothetical protein n=1 Tax=Candidatus Palauibacter sp. TaxID=3101350 RepID=UPI003B018BA9